MQETGRRWTSSAGSVSPESWSAPITPGLSLEWNANGGLLNAVVLDAAGSDGVRLDVRDNSVLSIGFIRNLARHSVWLELPENGRVSIAEYSNGGMDGVVAERGDDRFDNLGILTPEGWRDLASDDPIQLDDVRSAWAEHGRLEADQALLFTDAGLPEGATSGEDSWKVTWENGRASMFTLATAEWAVEIPPIAFTNGVVRMTEKASGAASAFVDATTT